MGMKATPSPYMMKVKLFHEKKEASGIHVGEKQPAIPANLRLDNSFDGLEMFH